MQETIETIIQTVATLFMGFICYRLGRFAERNDLSISQIFASKLDEMSDAIENQNKHYDNMKALDLNKFPRKTNKAWLADVVVASNNGWIIDKFDPNNGTVNFVRTDGKLKIIVYSTTKTIRVQNRSNGKTFKDCDVDFVISKFETPTF